MLDIKFIRENQGLVKKTCQDKRINLDIDYLLEIDRKRREVLSALEDMRAQKNKANKEIQKAAGETERKKIILKMQELDRNNDRLDHTFKDLDRKFNNLMLLAPNIPSKDTPIGRDERDNKEVEKWGVLPKFKFKAKDHIQLGKELDLIDLEAGARTSGFRGYYLKNEAAVIHFALIWHAFNKIRKKGFMPLIPPTLLREFALIGSGHFPEGREEVYQIGNYERLAGRKSAKEALFLAGTSEPSLLAFYINKIFDEKDLPIKICGLSQCYRSEAGSYGKDTKGLYRLHEFMKVEQVVICRDDIKESTYWLEEMRGISQEILKELKLPHRVVQICSGDMGAGKYKMYDIETWMPSRNSYGETHSDSNLTDWQARRLNIKYRDKKGNKFFVHTLNNTVIASPRILIAILENYQQKDGTVLIPQALQKYTGFKKILSKK